MVRRRSGDRSWGTESLKTAVKISGRGISDVIFQSVEGAMKVKKVIESVSHPLD